MHSFLKGIYFGLDSSPPSVCAVKRLLPSSCSVVLLFFSCKPNMFEKRQRCDGGRTHAPLIWYFQSALSIFQPVRGFLKCNDICYLKSIHKRIACWFVHKDTHTHTQTKHLPVICNLCACCPVSPGGCRLER